MIIISPSKIKAVSIAIFSVIGLSLLLALLAWILSALYFYTQIIASKFGYTYKLTDLVQAAVFTISGACTVAVIALYGVHRQNVSAEERHKYDKNLELRKDIILDAAASLALQYKFLITFCSEEYDDEKRQKIIEDATTPFFKLQTVCSINTIEALLAANQEFSIATISNTLDLVKSGKKAIDLRLAIERAKPYLEKLVLFNVECRKELNCAFENEKEYISKMNESFGRVEETMQKAINQHRRDTQ